MSQTDEEKNQLERDGHAAPQKTAGAKDTAASAVSVLERAARKASGSGHSRASVQEYMRVKRKF